MVLAPCKIFSLLHKNQKSFFFTGRIALGWSIESPSRSQRYSCRVRFLTWEEFLGHWKRPLSSLLYRRQKPSFSKCSALFGHSVSHKKETGNCCRDPFHRYPGWWPSIHQYFFSCRCAPWPGKISPHRTDHLTQLAQGKQSIADHFSSSLFVDLDTDTLHLKADRRHR